MKNGHLLQTKNTQSRVKVLFSIGKMKEDNEPFTIEPGESPDETKEDLQFSQDAIINSPATMRPHQSAQAAWEQQNEDDLRVDSFLKECMNTKICDLHQAFTKEHGDFIMCHWKMHQHKGVNYCHWTR